MNGKQKGANSGEGASSELLFPYQCLAMFFLALIMATCLRVAVELGLKNGDAVCIGITVLTCCYGYAKDVSAKS